MLHLFDTPIGVGRLILLGVALAIACGFEFVNGFHDTANAVATVIYTNSLKPQLAVIWSGLCNFLGVYLGGIAVAMSIIKLLPAELLVSSGSGAGLAMVLALLIAAILWNVGTWYFGLPASSSHTLIGGIVGVGLANSALPGRAFGSGVNWHKVQEIGISLILSPIVGLAAAALLLLLAKKWIKSPELYAPPEGKKPPPMWIRATLVGTCTGVSFAHGSNDGQKGVGLIMLILVGLLPADFALNTTFDKHHIDETIAITRQIDSATIRGYGGDEELASNAAVQVQDSPARRVLQDSANLRAALAGKETLKDVPAEERFDLRRKILSIDANLGALEKSPNNKLTADEVAQLKKNRAELRKAVDYAPSWVLVIVALSLGIGTMIGWKRIVVTVGEKIGKSHLSYAQGASAELVAMSTIGLSGFLGLPVSTTHVLSSGIAGTMVAQKSGLQGSTVRNIALAWLFTLPAAMVLSAFLFLFFRMVIPNASAAEHAPTVQVVSHESGGDENMMVRLPVADRPLRLHGSNTIGAELAPSLAEAFLKERGATDVHREHEVRGHAWVVSGLLPHEVKPLVIEIDAEGSATAFADLTHGDCDIGMSSRVVTNEEAARAQREGHGDLSAPASETVIALDGIAVIVNPNRPTSTLSMADLTAIFSGATTTWADAKGGTIDLYARDGRSGTFDAFKSMVLGKADIAGATHYEVSNKAVADAVARDENAIGFLAMGAIAGTKVLAISDAAQPLAPSRFTVATEDYPLTRRLYLYTPMPRSHPLTQEFVDFTTSRSGQAAVERAGMIDLSPRLEPAGPCAGCSSHYLDATKNAQRISIDFRFQSKATDLDTRASRDIPRLVAFLEHEGKHEVSLLGFADASGSSDANREVSKQRANAVADALAAYGVHAKRIESFGEEMPVATNATPAGRDRNRRVEVWMSDGP